MLHLASPYHSLSGGKIDDFVEPATKGTIHVLEGAMKEPGVKRVVVTSSITAIVCGHDNAHLMNRKFGPSNWTNLDSPMVSPYQRSKTKAEKLVWSFKEKQKPKFDICTMNPGVVVGPLLSKSACKATSSKQVKQLLTGAVPALPRIRVPIVDVRDVSRCHVRALDMTRDVNGKRYILCDKVV